MIELGAIQILKVERFCFEWNVYDGPDASLVLEGFCPIHKTPLIPCESCLPKNYYRLCEQCEALGKSEFHWRARVEYGQASIGPVEK
jgi:hypothetical protein